MGPPKFKETARVMGGLTLSDNDSARSVMAYREAHPMVVQLWNRAGNALPAIAAGPDGEKFVDSHGILRIEKGGIILPNQLRIKYPGLKFGKVGNPDEEEEEGAREGWRYIGRRNAKTGEAIEWGYIYGGKVVENIVQALARIIVMEQTGEVQRKFRDAKEVMTTHDEGVWVVDEDRADEVLAFAREAMSQSPSWARGLPVSAKGEIAVRYGDAK
jgi:hypothetical protein